MFRLHALLVVFVFAVSSHAQPTTAPVDLSQQKTLYVVGYAHLDTQWRWAYPQVIREFLPNTLHGNFDLFEKYPNYIFNFSGSRRYEMMKEYYPTDYQTLKKYITQGRWFVCGSSVDENDANVPSAESQIRHVLYGNQFARREFGKESHEFMLPDCFGFPAALPSILAHCGIRGFSTQKLTWGSANGIPFKVGVWEGPDGQSVIAAFDPGAYVGTVKEDLSQSASWLTRINNTGKLSNVFADYHYYGTGDRGGAPGESSVEWIEKSLAGNGPIKVVSSNADKMFLDITDAQREKLPRYQGELLLTEHSAGSVTSQAYMKRWNRKNELLADAAERASVAAMWLGGATYPSKRLYDAWDLVLGSQMHDMLPGTSLPKCYEYCWNDELLALNQFGNIATHGVGVIADAMDTTTEGWSLVVYNPLSIERIDVATAIIPKMEDVDVISPDGNTQHAQILRQLPEGTEIIFTAKVPSNATAVFEAKEHEPRKEVMPSVSQNMIENDRFKVTLNDAGDIASIFDKKSNREAIAEPIRLAFLYENPAEYPAWNMDWNDRKNPPRSYVTGPATIRIVERGPVRVTLEVARESEGSKFVQRVSLSAGGAGDRVEISDVIDWQTQQRSLKATFPFAAANPKATYGMQLGTLERGNNEPKKYEVPQHQWFDLTDASGKFGAAVINDCKYGSDKPDDRTLRLTLLYTPGTRGGFADQGTQDIGRHEMVYAIVPHDGDWRAAKIPWIAQRVNQPLRAFVTTKHAGALGKTFSMLSLSTDQVAVQSIKKAEDSDEIIVRIKELNGKPANDVQLKFASPILSAREVDGQERTIGEVKFLGNILQTDMTSYRLRAFAVKLAPPSTTVAPSSAQSVELPFDIDAVSSDDNRADGAFDAEARTYPAEQLPATIVCEGVAFKLGSTKDGDKNAVACHGQTINIPAGESVYLLASAINGDQPGTFKLGQNQAMLTIQNWSGYIGQWDNRLWDQEIPEQAFQVDANMSGLTPGYVKPGNVAWFASHRHSAKAGNAFYQYCYLYKYKISSANGEATTLTLPDNPNIRIFAISVGKDMHDETKSASPLSDTLTGRLPLSALSISPAGGTFADATLVQLNHGLYWNQTQMHFTVDGSEPTATSPKYSGPILLSSSVTLRARAIDAHGKAGEEVSAKFDINDTTPPKIVRAVANSILPQVQIELSEAVKHIEFVDDFTVKFDPPAKCLKMEQSADGRSINLTLDAPLTAPRKMSLADVHDVSANSNALSNAPVDVRVLLPVYQLEAFMCYGQEKIEKVAALPAGAKAEWTINFFVKANGEPENRTVIAGFGKTEGGSENGLGRYLSKFANGVHFWSRNQDVDSSKKLSIGEWQMLSATFDGTTLRLFADGKQIGKRDVVLADDEAIVRIAPVDPWDHERRFKGEIRQFGIWAEALSSETLESVYAAQLKAMPATQESK